MKTFDERTQQIVQKIDAAMKKRKRNRIITTVSVSLLFVLSVAAVLFVPYEWFTPSVWEYRDSGYYSLIQNLNRNKYRFEKGLTNGAPRNNFEYLLAKWNKDESNKNGGTSLEQIAADQYVENTDNQVPGVIEGDLVKRTQTHIFQLNMDHDSDEAILHIFTIDGAASKSVGTEYIDVGFIASSGAEMYLSDDGEIVTVIFYGNQKMIQEKNGKGMKVDNRVYVLSYDVSNPAKIQPLGEFCITGEYCSSRKVGQSIYLLSRKYVSSIDLDFDDKDTYLPKYNCNGVEQYLPPEAIVDQNVPDKDYLSTLMLLQEGSLDVVDSAALLSGSRFFYMSEEHIYISCSYRERTDFCETKDKTDIYCLSYTADSMEHIGTATVEGHIKNQYSMDEHNGMLRVVTTSRKITWGVGVVEQNANIYCISLDNWNIQGEVVAFAPWGEDVQSVRFDGDAAYVCTAINMQDPVYYFDLRDPKNIRWKDTGTIPGYSTSLRTFGEYLLGIGYNEQAGLKVVLYQETETGVEEVCIIDTEYTFSNGYKSYLFDEQNMIIGIPVYDNSSGYGDYRGTFVLWQLQGDRLVELDEVEVMGDCYRIRAVLIDDYLYVLGDNFVVKKIK